MIESVIVMNATVMRVARFANPVLAGLAGSRLIPLWGVVEHRGRRSGRAFRTPIAITRTADGFLIPLPWGPGTDWCRNIRAAGGCRVRWSGKEYDATAPEVVTVGAAIAQWPAPLRVAIRVVGIKSFLRLRTR